MFGLTAKIVQRPPSAEKIIKQLLYGTAVGLTKTAKEAQAAVQGSARGKFTIRNRWLEQQTPVGIKIKPAMPTNPVAEVYTKAPFGPRQEFGGTKIPYKHWLAIPITGTARPTKSSMIPKRNLPRSLQNAFVLTTKKGTTLLCVRKARGKNKGIVPMYVLVTRVQVKRTNWFHDPIEKVVRRRMMSIIDREIGIALAKMR